MIDRTQWRAMFEKARHRLTPNAIACLRFFADGEPKDLATVAESLETLHELSRPDAAVGLARVGLTDLVADGTVKLCSDGLYRLTGTYKRFEPKQDPQPAQERPPAPKPAPSIQPPPKAKERKPKARRKKQKPEPPKPPKQLCFRENGTTPVQRFILQTFATGLPLTRQDVARSIDDGKIGESKLACDFVFVILRQCVREKLLTQDDDLYYRLTSQGRQTLRQMNAGGEQ